MKSLTAGSYGMYTYGSKPGKRIPAKPEIANLAQTVQATGFAWRKVKRGSSTRVPYAMKMARLTRVAWNDRVRD
jgi:hypothetical protein